MKRFLYLILGALVLLSCNKSETEKYKDIKILGHGGMGYTSQYPINSLESILNAFVLGADGVEIDVQLSNDGQLVAFHNNDLSENTTNKGFINEHNWHQLQNTKYKDLSYASYSLYRLEDILNSLPNVQDKYLFIDCKTFAKEYDDNFFNNYITALLTLVDKFQLGEKFIIESPDAHFLQTLYSKNNNLNLYYYSNDLDQILNFPNIEIIKGVMFRQENYSKTEIDIIKVKGLKTAAWSFTNKNDLDNGVAKQIDFAQVDNLRKILKQTK